MATTLRQPHVMLFCFVIIAGGVATSAGAATAEPASAEDSTKTPIRLTPLPEIDSNTSDSLVIGQAGHTVFLKCFVRNLADQMVSWVRQRDWHILTSGRHIYTADERFQIQWQPKEPDDSSAIYEPVRELNASTQWILQILFASKNDSGIYICQVPTEQGLLWHQVTLDILVPEVFILGQKDLIVDTGTTLSLVCIIENSPIPPEFVFWYHNERLLNFDPSRPDVSVETEHEGRTHSQLKVANAQEKDSGNYTCRASHGQPASIHVQVWTGDQAAAMSRKNGAMCRLCVSTSNLLSSFLIFLVSIDVFHLSHRFQR